MSMFVRVKREKSTYFLHCSPGDVVLRLKQELCTILGEGRTPEQVRLLSGEGTILPDSATLASCGVENDTVLNMVLQKEGSSEFETVNVFRPVFMMTDEDKRASMPDSLVNYLDDMKPQSSSSS
eukprot:RCo031442